MSAVANEEHVRKLAEGVDAWNEWRRTSEGRVPDLAGAVFNGREFPGFDLSQAILKNTRFRNANLTGANLQHADARGAHFEGANLTSADLRMARIESANFQDARMPGAMVMENDAGLRPLSSEQMSLLNLVKDVQASDGVDLAIGMQINATVTRKSPERAVTVSFAVELLSTARIAVRSLPPPEGLSDDDGALYDEFVASVEKAFQRNNGMIDLTAPANVAPELPLWKRISEKWLMASAEKSAVNVFGTPTAFCAGFVAGMLYRSLGDGPLDPTTIV